MIKASQSEKCQYALIILFYSFPLWFNYIVDRLPMSFFIGHTLLLLPFLCLLYNKHKLLGKYMDVFVVYLVVFMLFFLKFSIDPSMTAWLKKNTYSVYRFILYPGSGIFAYGVLRFSDRKDIILKCMRIIGVALFIYYFLQSLEVIKTGTFIYEIFGEERQSKYNISFGYGMLAAITFLTIDYAKFKKKWVLPLIGVGLVEIVSFGSRVPSVVYIFLLIMLILFYDNYSNKSKKHRRRLISILLFLAVILWLFYFGGLMFVSQQLSKIGIESRTLAAFLQGGFTDDNGRYRIWERVTELIHEHPFTGMGVFGERNAVYGIGMKWGYAHNIFLEVIVDFGYPIGLALIGVGVFFLMRAIIKPKDKDYQLLIIGFLTISLELIFSNSYWFHMGFWSLLALCVNYMRETGRKIYRLGSRMRKNLHE